jgi:penicillin-binding protein 1A
MRMRTKIIIAVLVIIFGLIAGGFLALIMGIPSIDELKKYDRAAGTKIYADDDSLIGEIKLQKGIYVSLSKMPKNLKNAIVAVEDRRFWEHSGIDYLGIGRALVKDILSLSLKEGGSTITQQLAKIVYLSSEKTVVRKIKEAQLALTIEKNLSKKDILELYLNRAFFGHSAYGVEMASRTYFGKSVGNINLAEAAMIAGLAKAPNSYSPINDLVRAKERQAIVLNRMVEEGYIKPAQAEAAKKQPLHLSQTRDSTETFNYFIDYIRQYLVAKYGEERVYRGNLKVHTTLNRSFQIYAQKSLQEGLRDVDKRKGWRGPAGKRDNVKDSDEERVSFTATAGDIAKGVVMSVGPKEAVIKSRGVSGKLALADAMWASNVIDRPGARVRHIKDFNLTHILKKGDVVFVRFKNIARNNITFRLEQEPEVEGAIAVVEPATGYLRAMAGGFSYTRSEFNRAIMAQRQPGSSFKPIVYAAALENGYTPASVVVDEPVTYGSWTPENSDRKYMGPISLRTGLAYSRNIISVKLVKDVGVDKVINLARSLGIQGKIPSNLSIALGSAVTTPLDMAVAFSVFANGGIKMKTTAIKYITGARGEIIESNHPESTQVISAASAFQLTSMMEDVLRYGTGARANIGRPAAGKTGTSNDYKDAWFVGYTPELSAAVWVGFDDMRHSLGHGEVGGRVAAPVWKRFMSSALSGRDAVGFNVPQGLVRTRVDKATGLLPDPLAGESETIEEYFKEGSAPTAQAGRSAAPSQPFPEIED